MRDDRHGSRATGFGALESLHPAVSLILAAAILAGIAVLDYVTGYEMGFSFFYLIPVALVAWINGRWPGIAAAAVAAATWGFIDNATGHHYSASVYLYWNSGMRLLIFVSMALLLSALHRALSQERALARIDHLTGAFNARSFLPMVQAEVDRSRRYLRPFSLAYVDVDNFKAVNDSLGHAAGDELLRAVVVAIREHLRASDIVARLGGDEFAVLLPETNQAAARSVIDKIRSGLVAKVREHGWQVTLSIGCVTHTGTDVEANALIRQADDLMYRAKMAGKDGATFDGGA